LDGPQSSQFRLSRVRFISSQKFFEERQALVLWVEGNAGNIEPCADNFDFEAFDYQLGKIHKGFGPLIAACRAGDRDSFYKRAMVPVVWTASGEE